MRYLVIALSLMSMANGVAFAQETPTILKKDLPKKAVCFVCSQSGEEHGEEKPAGGIAYRGKSYYFCSKKEMEAFVKEPDAYIPAPLPRSAPAFRLVRTDGATVSLDELSAGRTLLVDFWATWCGPCVKAMPELQKLHQRYANDRFSVVGVSIDEEGAKKVAPFLAKQKTRYTYPMLLDTADTWKRWGVRALPTLILVKDGQIVAQWTGKIDLKSVEAQVKIALEKTSSP